MHKPRHDAPPPPADRREISPSIRTYAQAGVHDSLTQAGRAFDAIVGRKAMAEPENAALFAILVELQRVMRHPEPTFDELKRLIDDLEYLKGLEASR